MSIKELKCSFCGKPLKLQTYESRLVLKDGCGGGVIGHITCWNKQGHNPPPASKPDEKMIEIFDYFFGIDITNPKYQEGLTELAEYLKKITGQAILDFYAPTELKPEPLKKEDV